MRLITGQTEYRSFHIFLMSGQIYERYQLGRLVADFFYSMISMIKRLQTNFFRSERNQVIFYFFFFTLPSESNPRISMLIDDVRPLWTSCKCRNKFKRDFPRPLSISPWVNTPRRVDLPASAQPKTAILRSINCRKNIAT